MSGAEKGRLGIAHHLERRQPRKADLCSLVVGSRLKSVSRAGEYMSKEAHRGAEVASEWPGGDYAAGNWRLTTD